MRRFSSLLLLIVLSTGCVSTTVIRSNPSGASVRSRSGEMLGRTPYEYSDSAMVNHAESFTLELDGYATEFVTIRRDQWNGARTAGGIVGGLFVFPVFATLLWAADYKDAYHVELSEAGDEPVARGQPVRERRVSSEKVRASRR
ncbi:MAG: PEGA domain-containing protein [Cystobacter sp.]